MGDAARRLRQKPCLCQKGVTHYGPHAPECPRYIDRSRAKNIAAALIEKRHNEGEGEWLSLSEFYRIDLFSFRTWAEWPDEKLSKRTGLKMRVPLYRRVAYEIKVSRSDFRNEIRRPEKRASGVALSHQFFFATPPGLVRRDELPPECGLVEVTPGGEVKVIRHAPIRKPTQAFTTGDMVALLRAKHLGPSSYQLRNQARIASGLLKAAQAEHTRAERLLQLARVRLIREKGHLLEAGSEWIGPWPWRGHSFGSSGDNVPPETRVVLTQVSVGDYYDTDDTSFRATGSVNAKAVEKVESSGDFYGSEWMDAGDFLIAFRHVAEPAKVAPPPRSDLFTRARPKLVALDGELDNGDSF